MKKRVAIFVSLVLVISFVSAGLFDGITGNALWDNNHCSTRNLCPPGEGDCDRDSHCLTNYCAQNVGSKYGQSAGMDVCECREGTTWDGSSCVGECTPQTCEGLGAECGNWNNGCGGTLYCGSCASGQTCQGGVCVVSEGDESLWAQSGNNIYYNTGNVGIGTMEPDGKLQLGSSLYETDLLVFGNYDAGWTKAARMGVVYPYMIDTRLISDASGWGFGWTHEEGTTFTPNPGAKHTMMFLAPQGQFGANYRLWLDGYIALGDINKDYSSITAGFPAMSSKVVINPAGVSYFNGGKVGIGTTSPTQKLDVAGNVRATSFLYSSDERLKENIEPIPSALEKVQKLEGVCFDWKEGGQSIGLVAQNVEEVFPELVSTDENTGMKSVQYGNLVAVLIEAIKEQQEQIDELKAEVEKLKSK